jgi:cytochrome P450
MRWSAIHNILFPELLKYLFTPADRRLLRNVKSFQDSIRKIIAERKAEKRSSDDEIVVDLLSILISFDEYKNDEESILQELFGFFFAGMKTLQYSTMNMTYYLTRHPEFKQKLKDEICPPVEAVKDDIVGKLDYDTVMDFSYLQYCFMESLRIEPPASISTAMTCTADLTLGSGDFRVTLPKGTIFHTLAQEIHKHPVQWREPHSYNPARFDNLDKDNIWTLTTEGKPRNPLSHTPFFGGKRICLGKTFAEMVVRFTMPLLFHFLEFDFVDAKQGDHKDIFSAEGQQVDLPFIVSIKNECK